MEEKINVNLIDSGTDSEIDVVANLELSENCFNFLKWLYENKWLGNNISYSISKPIIF